jgi:hypothetical protein
MEYHAGDITEGRYVIRSCFGGLRSAFVASGSEVSLVLSLPKVASPQIVCLHIGGIAPISVKSIHSQ